jgi:hypothetical protein
LAEGRSGRHGSGEKDGQKRRGFAELIVFSAQVFLSRDIFKFKGLFSRHAAEY